MAKKNTKGKYAVSESQANQALLGFVGLFALMGLAYVFGGKK